MGTSLRAASAQREGGGAAGAGCRQQRPAPASLTSGLSDSAGGQAAWLFLTQHLLHLGVGQALDLRQPLQQGVAQRNWDGTGAAGQVRVQALLSSQPACVATRTLRVFISSDSHVWYPAQRGGIECCCLKGTRHVGAGRCRQQRRRQPRRSPPASLAFLMSPRLIPSASSFSTGCRRAAADRRHWQRWPEQPAAAALEWRQAARRRRRRRPQSRLISLLL